MELLFIDKVKTNRTEFENKVILGCKNAKIDPNDLMFVMFNESGLDSTIQNSIGATGLIQFMPSTARYLGTTPEKLHTMSNVDQLDYVFKYYKYANGKIKSGDDLYLFAFFPIALGKPDNWVIQSKKLSAKTIALQNKAFDLDKNQIITVGEFRQYLRLKLAKTVKDIEIINRFFEKKEL